MLLLNEVSRPMRAVKEELEVFDHDDDDMFVALDSDQCNALRHEV